MCLIPTIGIKNIKLVKINGTWEDPTPVFSNWVAGQNGCKSICVLGAGNGYDPINFAKYGHKVTAVDFSKRAVDNLSKTSLAMDLKIDIRYMDLFKLGELFSAYFDVVIEYTCLCAIDPDRRAEFCKVVHKILKQKGEFISLLFPINKEDNREGPPFGINLDSMKSIFREKFRICNLKYYNETISARKGNEIFITMIPKP